MGIKTKFNPMGGKKKLAQSSENIQKCNYAYLVNISSSYYGATPTVTVTNLTSKITTSGATICGQASAKFILLGGKIFNTSTSSFISNIEGFTSIGCGYDGVLAVKNGIIYCFNTSGSLLYTDNSLSWKSVEAPIYMSSEYYRKYFFGLTSSNQLYQITIGTSSLTKTLKNYGDSFPHGSNYYDDITNFLKGTTVYTSSGGSIITGVLSCVGQKSSYAPATYKTDSSTSRVRTALLAVKSDGLYMVTSSATSKLLSGSNCMVTNMSLSANGWEYADGRTVLYWPLISNGSLAYIVQTDGTLVSTGLSNIKFIEGGIYTTYISHTASSSYSSLNNSAIVINNSNNVYVVYGNGYTSYKEPSSLKTLSVSGISGNITGVYGGSLNFLITAV